MNARFLWASDIFIYLHIYSFIHIYYVDDVILKKFILEIRMSELVTQIINIEKIVEKLSNVIMIIQK